MKSFALALFAASSDAMLWTSIASTTTSNANAFTTLSSAKIEWGYDANNVYVNVESAVVLNQAARADTDAYTIAAIIPFDAAKQWAIGCYIQFDNTNTQFTPNWIFMDPNVNIDLATGGSGATSNYNDSKNLNTAKYARAGSATATNSEDTTTTDSADSANTAYHILTGSKAKLDTAKTGITCTTKAKKSGYANLTASNLVAVQLDGLAEGSNKFFFHANIGTSNEAKLETVTTVLDVIADSTTQGSGNIKYEGTGYTTTAITKSEHTVNVWTDANTVYLNFEMKITSSVALANTKSFQSMTCARIATTSWLCAMMDVTGQASSKAKWTWKAFSSTTTPASLTLNKKVDATENLGNVATFIPKFVGTSAATIAADTPGVQLSTKVGFRHDPNWAWSTTANKMDASLKIFEGSLQYTNLEPCLDCAKTVTTAIRDYAAYSYVGCFDNTSTDSAKFGTKALAAPSAAVVQVTSSALSLASIGAAIALAMAF